MNIDLKIGVSVSKIGRSIGLTFGQFCSIISIAGGGRYFVDHVQVLWNEGDCRFASSIDIVDRFIVSNVCLYR